MINVFCIELLEDSKGLLRINNIKLNLFFDVGILKEF